MKRKGEAKIACNSSCVCLANSDKLMEDLKSKEEREQKEIFEEINDLESLLPDLDAKVYTYICILYNNPAWQFIETISRKGSGSNYVGLTPNIHKL